jgi:putative endonuclease
MLNKLNFVNSAKPKIARAKTQNTRLLGGQGRRAVETARSPEATELNKTSFDIFCKPSTLRQAQCLRPENMEKYFTYILLCNQKTYYVGVTNNLDKRLAEHKSGTSQYTSQFSDIELVYFEEYPTLVLARRRETQLKGWSHAKKYKYILGKVSK